MELQSWPSMAQAAVNIAMILGGWILKTLWYAQKEMAHDLAKLREEMPKTYVPKDDFRDTMTALFKKLDRIEDKLDDKEDKI